MMEIGQIHQFIGVPSHDIMYPFKEIWSYERVRKQNIVARFSAMATATCELIWIKELLQEL